MRWRYTEPLKLSLTAKLLTVSILCTMFASCSDAQRSVDRQEQSHNNAMKKSYVVASPYRGQLLRNGEPVANQKVINELRWTGRDDNPMLREIMTDEEGFFEVKEYTVELDLGMFEEFTGRSHLYLNAKTGPGTESDRDYLMRISRGDFESGYEFGEPPEDMQCEINNELRGFDLQTGIGRTKCVWNNMYRSDLFR